MRTCLFMLPSRPVAPMDARVQDAVPRSVLWVAGASLGHGGFQGCFRPSHMACVTVGVRAGPERSPVRVLPFPAGPWSSCAATVRCATGSLRRSLGLGSLPGRVRPTTELLQRCPRTAAGKEPGKEQRVLPCYKECQPGIPKLALICPKVTLSHVKTFWEAQRESMLPEAKGFLEVLQQAEDALLLVLPELRAPAITDVLCILWGDKGSVRRGSKVYGWVPRCPSLNLAPAEVCAVLKTLTPTTTPLLGPALEKLSHQGPALPSSLRGLPSCIPHPRRRSGRLRRARSFRPVFVRV